MLNAKPEIPFSNRLSTLSQNSTSQFPCTINTLKKLLNRAIWADKKWPSF